MAKIPLHDLLCELVGMPFSDGKNHCYFQPPADIEMNYPCFVYNYTNDVDFFADDIHYRNSKRYTVTYITHDPDSKISDRMKSLRHCSSDRNFSVNGLNHFVYTLYYDGPRIKEEENGSKN